MERESMEFDVVIVGAGPAGLTTAIHLAQLAKESSIELSICLLEKGAEVGAHILSGAVFDTRALDELLPNWQNMGAPIDNPVTSDKLCYLTTQHNHIDLPHALTPTPLRNSEKQHIISLGNLCRWLANYAERLGVEVFTGFPAASISYSEDGAVMGVITADMGLDKQGEPKANFEAGIELKAKYTVFAEGARGHLGKELIKRFKLDEGKQPQHYALGFKELWQLPDDAPKQQGRVIHTAGYPLSESHSTGGGFLYYIPNNQVAVGLIVDLNYSNTYLSPYDEFQRFKHHPLIAQHLQGAERVSYGARALAKGGLHSLPKQQFAGGVLIGCDAGTLNAGRIKGCHTAMKSGMIAAEALFEQLASDNLNCEPSYESHFNNSWLFEELEQSANFSASLHKFGSLLGGALNSFEHNLWRPLFARKPWTITNPIADHLSLNRKADCKPIEYPKPDGVISFDKASSLYLSGTQHEENQPCHLKLRDPLIPITEHLEAFDEPSQRYCPAGVYEIVELDGERKLQINAANCLHCKTCDIKDPSQNIDWQTPEGGGGPSYPNM